MNLKYFKLSEFDSPDEPGSGEKMDINFLSRLDLARGEANIPFLITSGFRTVEHNLEVGGVTGSAHTKGCAADISVQTSKQRYKVLKALEDQGFNRIGIGEFFIHVDSDPDKPSNVIWHYYKNSHSA